MDIYWLGHSCFRIKGNRTTVITDPYSPELGYKAGKLSADIVTISHSHPGHSYVEAVSDVTKVINGPGEYEIGGVIFIGMNTYHDTEKGASKGKNTVYLMEIDEMTVCHLGDLGHSLSADQVEDIDEIDVLMLPVGGGSSLTASEAAEMVRQIAPKIVIPMHYKTDAISRELAPVDAFLKEMAVQEIEPQPKLTLNRSTIPQNTQVVLLSYPD